jgi:Protein of unknown function (DUF3710)
MAFGRRREASTNDDELTAGDPVDTVDEVLDDDAEALEGDAAGDRSQGPWDFSDDGLPELPEGWGRMDLSALVLTLPDGVEVRLDVDEASQTVGAVGVVLEPLMLQLMAYAAPKTMGIWEEIRAEIAANATSSGGTVHNAQGRFGQELLAQLPADGGGRVEARFIGVDGPRWFLRGVVSGPGAHDDEVSALALDILSQVTVVRDDEARPSQEPLPVTVPRDPQHRAVPLDV